VTPFFKNKAVALASIVLVGQAVFYYSSSAKEVIPTVSAWSQFPSVAGNWTAIADFPLEPEVLDKLQPDDYLNRNYGAENGQKLANLFIGYFNTRRNGRAPHSPQWCLPGAGWKSVFTRRVSIPVDAGTSQLPANEYLVEKGVNQELVLYWYHQGTRTVANEVVAQVYALPEMILHLRTDTALVRIIVPVPGRDSQAAIGTAVGFAQAVYPLVLKHIL
jgi:EpsI family protein